MKKHCFFLLVVLMAFLVVSGCSQDVGVTDGPEGPGEPGEEEIVKLRLQSAYGRGDISTDTLKEHFADAAEKHSGGTLQIEVFAEPEIVSMFETPAAAADGLIDLMHGHGALWAGRGINVGDIEFGLPLAWRIPEKPDFRSQAEEAYRFYFEEGFADLLREEYAKDGIYWLGFQSNGPVPFWIGTEKAAEAFQGTPEDLEGLVVRTDGLWMEWNHRVGMTGVDVPSMDAYTGLQTGTFDSHIWDMSVYLGLGFEEIAPYLIRGLENDHSMAHIVVNMDVWEGLSAEHQEALTKAADDYFNDLIDIYIECIDQVQDLIDEGVITVVQVSDANVARHKEAALEIWDEIAERDEACAKAVEMFKEWRGME